MKPDLEVVQIERSHSFKAWEYGYPYYTVRWHFYPEYEIHHVVATSGRTSSATSLVRLSRAICC